MEALKTKVTICSSLYSIVKNNLGPEWRGPVLVGKAGSGREYYRLWHQDKSLVLMQSYPSDQEFDLFLKTSEHLVEQGMPVPKIYGFSHQSQQILLEDLGDQTLLSLHTESPLLAQEFYPKALELLVNYQNKGVEKLWQVPEVFHRNFGYLDLLWETEYFYDHFLSRYVRLEPQEKKQLFESFELLANRTDRHHRTLMHRDYQSQNLMVEGDHLRLIDYQGMRMGSEFYDVASLLWDPYTELSYETVKQLFDTYMLILDRRESAADWKMFLEASLQRIMQACGAYGYLSQIRGYRDFEKYLLPGWSRLRFLVEIYNEDGEFDILLKALNQVNTELL